MLEWLKDAFDYIVIGTIYDIIKECKRNPVYRLQVTLAHIALLLSIVALVISIVR